jgi:hypothetical protein
MAYVAPSTRTTGDLITAAIWNQDVVANVLALAATRTHKLFIPASAFTDVGNTTLGAFADIYPYREFPDAVDGEAAVGWTMPADWNGGAITLKLLHYSTASANNIKLTSQLAAMQLAEGTASTALSTTSTTYTAGGDQLRELTFHSAIAPNAADIQFGVSIIRVGGSVDDALGAAWQVFGLLVEYTATANNL